MAGATFGRLMLSGDFGVVSGVLVSAPSAMVGAGARIAFGITAAPVAGVGLPVARGPLFVVASIANGYNAAHYKLVGITKDAAGNLVRRRVLACYLRAPAAIIADTLSDPVTGAFEIRDIGPGPYLLYSIDLTQEAAEQSAVASYVTAVPM
jgi:hypothetical protein